jgi:hypothetical protein
MGLFLLLVLSLTYNELFSVFIQFAVVIVIYYFNQDKGLLN